MKNIKTSSMFITSKRPNFLYIFQAVVSSVKIVAITAYNGKDARNRNDKTRPFWLSGYCTEGKGIYSIHTSPFSFLCIPSPPVFVFDFCNSHKSTSHNRPSRSLADENSVLQKRNSK